MTPKPESEWLQPGEVCLTCGRTTPAAIEGHHVAGHANDPNLKVPACRKDGSYCHNVLTEQQRARGVRLDYEERSESDRMVGVVGGFTDVLALAMRHIKMNVQADSMERLGDDGTRMIFEITPPDSVADRVIGPNPRLRDRRVSKWPAARTSAKRWRTPRVRKPPPPQTLEKIDRAQFDGFFELTLGTARAMHGDSRFTRAWADLAERRDEIRAGLTLLIESERGAEFFTAAEGLNRRLADATPTFDPRASIDDQGRTLFAVATAASAAFGVLVDFYTQLACAETIDDACAALDEFVRRSLTDPL
jgi:hypothetical protein